MNRVSSRRPLSSKQRQKRYFRKAQVLIGAAAQSLREARHMKPGKFPEGAQDIFFRDVEDLLREARRYVRKGRRAKAL